MERARRSPDTNPQEESHHDALPTPPSEPKKEKWEEDADRMEALLAQTRAARLPKETPPAEIPPSLESRVEHIAEALAATETPVPSHPSPEERVKKLIAMFRDTDVPEDKAVPPSTSGTGQQHSFQRYADDTPILRAPSQEIQPPVNEAGGAPQSEPIPPSSDARPSRKRGTLTHTSGMAAALEGKGRTARSTTRTIETEGNYVEELERERLEGAALEPHPNSPAENKAKLKALYELKTKYGSVRPMAERAFEGYNVRSVTAASSVEGITPPPAMHREEEIEVPRSPARSDVLLNSNMFSEYHQAMKKALGEEEPLVAPPAEREEEQPVVMLNSVLNRIAFGRDHIKRKSKKSVSEGGTVYKAKVFESIDGDSTTDATPGPFAPLPRSHWQEGVPAPAELDRSPEVQKRKGKFFKGVLAALAVFSGSGSTDTGPRPHALPMAHVVSGTPFELPRAHTPMSESETVQVEAVPQTDDQATASSPLLKVQIEKRGEGADIFFSKMQKRLQSAHLDESQQTPLFTFLLNANPNTLSHALHFAQGNESAVLHKGDNLELDGNGRLLFHSRNKTQVLMHSTSTGPQVAEFYSGEMRPYAWHHQISREDIKAMTASNIPPEARVIHPQSVTSTVEQGSAPAQSRTPSVAPTPTSVPDDSVYVSTKDAVKGFEQPGAGNRPAPR
jgi:hypothetical protein